MRKVVVAFGFLLLLAGMFIISTSNIPVEKAKTSTVAQFPQSWEASGNFSAGEKLIVVPHPGENWTGWLIDPPVDPKGRPVPQSANFTIVDPNGVEAKIKLFYEPSSEFSSDIQMYIYNITVVEDGSLIISNPPGEVVGGIVTQNGTYLVRTYKEWWMGGPPDFLILYREFYLTEYPYSSFFPAGAALGVFGVVTFIVGVKLSKRERRVRLKRSVRVTK